jgi:hypothetical protein
MTAQPGNAIVILQPQFFPWRGVFEQVRLADEFVHLDDAQFQKGGFTNRVQIKTANGSRWLTVPVLRSGTLPPINETEIDYKTCWREKHLRTLRMAYARAPHVDAMCTLVDDIYAGKPHTIAELNIAALERVARELNLEPRFTLASATPVTTKQTERLVDLLLPRGATQYITGLGALAYLDERAFARRRIDVRVMEYARTPYPQLHGPFDPHVSILDLLANTGRDAARHLVSTTLSWRDYATRAAQANPVTHKAGLREPAVNSSDSR